MNDKEIIRELKEFCKIVDAILVNPRLLENNNNVKHLLCRYSIIRSKLELMTNLKPNDSDIDNILNILGNGGKDEK